MIAELRHMHMLYKVVLKRRLKQDKPGWLCKNCETNSIGDEYSSPMICP